jgi:hypothetical protein
MEFFNANSGNNNHAFNINLWKITRDFRTLTWKADHSIVGRGLEYPVTAKRLAFLKKQTIHGVFLLSSNEKKAR